MLEIKNFKEEAISVLKWLIAIPSITRTSGESRIIEAIHKSISDFTYFKNHGEHLRYVTHSDHQNHSILAFVRRDLITTETLVVLCNSDTSNNDCYGSIKPFAFKSDDLKEHLKNADIDEEAKACLENEDNIYGLGSFESKAPTAGVMVLLKELSDKLWMLPCNILFVISSQSLNAHQGIRECLPYINDLIKEQKIKLKLSLTFRPETLANDENRFRLYTGNMGKIETCFYILGKGANPERPFTGFSPTIVASKLISEIELNPNLTDDLASRPLLPTFNYLRTHNNRSANTPSSAVLSFSFPFINIDLVDLVEILKKTAAYALEQAANLIDERHCRFDTMMEREFEPMIGEAEVISYSDLFYRASRHYKGNLTSAIDGLLQKCLSDGLSTNDTAKTIIERLIELTKLPRPSIVVFFGKDFIPQQLLRRNHSEDRELYININQAVEEFNNLPDTKTIDIENECQPNDGCFIRPVGIDLALKSLKTESPIPVNTFYNLNAPSISVTYKGKDLYCPTEHVDADFFTQMLNLMDKLLLCINQEEKN